MQCIRRLISIFAAAGLLMAAAMPAMCGFVDDQRDVESGSTATSTHPAAKRTWRVMVVIPEWHIQRPVPDPAAETAVVDAFIKAGYRMMDLDLAAKHRYDAAVVNALNSRTMATIKSRFSDAKADILIVGEAFSQGTSTSLGNMISCRARVELKAIRRDSGEIIASQSAQEGGLDLTEELAGKTALTRAGEVVAKKLLEDIDTLPAADSVPTEVIITGLKSVGALGEIEAEMGKVPGVRSVQRDEFDKGIATLEVFLDPAKASSFQTDLGKLKSHKLDIIRSTKNSLTVFAAD